MAGTVLVACKLPNGLQLRLGPTFENAEVVTVCGPAFKLDSTTHQPISSGFGLTIVDKDFWDAWVLENKDFGPLKNGMLFAHAKGDNTKAEAKEKVGVKTTLEPMDPSQPIPGIKPDDLTVNELRKAGIPVGA